ncbi:MAG: helix-turn-helix domain-containing protein [Pseudonocardiaceae bacterium]
MISQSPILSPEQLDSATSVMIDEQIRFEVRHLLASLDLTQSAFARAIGYGEGTVSKWKSGQQRLSEGGAKSIDDKGYGPTTLGLSFSDLLRLYRACAGSGGENGTHTTWDVFLSMPMASAGQDYETTRADAQQIRAALEEYCGWQAFFAGADIPTANDFDTPDLALQINCVALRMSATFMMTVLQPLARASSVFVEAGFALALDKPSVYFVRDRRVLPYILREASVHSAVAGLPTVRVCEVDDPAQVIGRIRRHKGDLFKAI